MFDQALCTDNRYVLEVDETRMPPEYAPVLRRLQGAAANPEFEASMRLEDEVVGEWRRMEHDIAQRDEALAQQQGTIAQQEEALAQRDGVAGPSRSSRRPLRNRTRSSNARRRRSRSCGGGWTARGVEGLPGRVGASPGWPAPPGRNARVTPPAVVIAIRVST